MNFSFFFATQLTLFVFCYTADLTDVELRWKQQFVKWEEEYIVDWKHQFEQYQRLQRYRYYDSQCQNDDFR